MLPFALILGPLWQNKGRLLLSVFAIAMGVALGYAVQLINRVAVNELEQAVQVLAGDADLTVRGPRAGFDESLYPRIARMPEVAVASPVLELDVKVIGRDEPLRVVATDALRAVHVQPGLLPQAGNPLDVLRGDTIFLTPAAAQWLQAEAGQPLRVQVGLDERTLYVAGILSRDSRGQRLGVMDIAGAQRLFRRLGVINRLDLRLRAGVDAARFGGTLQALLPAGVHADRPEAAAQSSASVSRAYRVNLNVLALVALFTGGLLIFSTQALAVMRRRAQFALLRVLGLTRARLVGLIVIEGAVTGALGAVCGLAGGYLLAGAILRTVGVDLGSGYFRGLAPTLSVEPAALLVFLALGIIVAAAGSLVPAIEAARVEPAPALKAGDEQRAFSRLQSVWPGLTLVGAGLALTRFGPLDGLPIPGYVAIALLLLGTVMLMPRFAVFVIGRLPLLQAPAAQLAVAQLRGAPGQATVSLAAVVAAVSLMVSMAIMVASFRHSLEEWLDHVLPAELYLRTSGSGDTAYLTPQDQARIAALPGVRRVEFQRSQHLLLDPRRPRVTLLARDIDPTDPAARVPLVGAFVVPPAGGPPPVWVTEVVADWYGFTVGRQIELPVGGRKVGFLVAGIWRDYARQNGALLIERRLYIELTGDADANDAALWLEPGAGADAVDHAIRTAVPGGRRIEIARPGEIRRISLGIFDRTFAVTYALEAVAVVIGLFGLSGSVGTLVLARRREFGVLRHLGMTRRQIGAMLATEGAVLSGIGLLAGVALGWIISLILIRVVNPQSFHWSMDLHMPWISLIAFAAVMFALSTLTALASGRQAMSGQAVRAVREDW